MKLYTRLILTACLVLTAACGTPKNIVYFQDIEGDTTLATSKADPIRFKPMDQISVIVNSRDPQVTAMFNLPYYTNRIGQTQSMTTTAGNIASGTQGISGYIVDSDGNIDFPVLGKIYVAGLTREETADKIKEELLDSRQIKDPVVTVTFMNLGFSVLGEVNHPGRYKIDRDRFTILEALALAGDLTINAERENIVLVRQEGDKDHAYELNLLDTKHEESTYTPVPTDAFASSVKEAIESENAAETSKESSAQSQAEETSAEVTSDGVSEGEAAASE